METTKYYCDNDGLSNQNLDPVKPKDRNWYFFDYVCLWASLSITIPTYMLGSSLISFGMNWWQAALTILLGNLFTILPMILVSRAGAKYGISFPILLRSSFGINGARAASIIRAIVACGWFGIQSTIGGMAIYLMVSFLFPDINKIDSITFIELNPIQLLCIIVFVLLQIYLMKHGMYLVKKISLYVSPILACTGLIILIWSYHSVGSIEKILDASYKIGELYPARKVLFSDIFWPCLASIIGFWSTLILNIPDFTRFSFSQKSHTWGQFIAMPTIMFAFGFIGIFVTSASFVLFGEALWNPVDLVQKIDNGMLKVLGILIIISATFVSNIMANLVASSNDFSNLFPKRISFARGAMITGCIGLVIMPWKLIDDPSGYIFKWLIAYSSFLGAFAGIMLSDYYLHRKTKLDINQLYMHHGAYYYNQGWNISAFITLFLSTLPCMPGLLVEFNVIGKEVFPYFITNIYNYSWLISCLLALAIYKILMSGPRAL